MRQWIQQFRQLGTIYPPVSREQLPLTDLDTTEIINKVHPDTPIVAATAGPGHCHKELFTINTGEEFLPSALHCF